MYLHKEIKTVIIKMGKLYDSPINLLVEKSGFSRPTVSKFFNYQEIKPSSIQKIYELCLDLIEAKDEMRQFSIRRENQLFCEMETHTEPN